MTIFLMCKCHNFILPWQDSIFIGSDLNGHVARDADGYVGVHGGMGFGTRNAEGEIILEFGDAVGMVVCNTFFKHRMVIGYRLVILMKPQKKKLHTK